ncbi:proton-conducting transporter membrane subunit [Actinophytocola oryzae]|uniref:NADH:ubiquinone oxidoreductase subunit 5 (Subunit L)/multisubunit Na+/H+ antiporter MnhA subunit n=1 Tax=Actinophytocola oryzae TaxID=502181 RepID=A0A4R7W421_9PSEU|nr:proton-conducting transporter membrane subunit [Actinophytocola oryzae]TDV57314.1 NADH:ubiquinone oxidoreductase subunit 5 (subunit L)/multisubunit Na+/H+ antiporter MnhA subunit [Actinophytocola oryzae]
MLLWFLVALPLCAGVALLVTRAPHTVAVMAAVATAVLAVVAAVARPAASVAFLDGISFGLAVDGLSAAMVVTVAVVLVAVLVFATGEPGLDHRFHGLMLVFAAAMLVTVTATTLVTLLMAWEVMGAASYALIGYWWREPRRVRSGLVAFLTTRAADLGLYLAAGAALAGGAHGLDLTRLPDLPDGWRDLATAGLVVAALGKSAQLPFSFWLSRAMDGPSPVSAFLHSATMVAAGAYLLLRTEPLLGATPWAAVVVAWAGAATALLLGAVAVVQRDLKQLLAASTCAQVGFMVFAAGTAGASAGTAHLVAHALTKSLLFLCAGAWLTAVGTRDLDELRGVAGRHRVTGVAFTAGALTLAGIPPLSLWATKDRVLTGALTASLPLYLVGLAAAALSAAYAGRALALVWTPSTTDRTRVPPAQQAVLLPLAAGALVIGVLPGFRPDSGWWEPVVSGALALLVTGATVAAVRRRDLTAPAPLLHWLGLENLARTVVVRPTLATARHLARFDDRAVAGTVHATARIGATVARLVDRRVEWSIDGAVRLVTHGFRTLGRLARRPQTGRLHHYYAQAVVALAALAALLLLIR